MRKLLLATAFTCLATAANAVSITVGYLDAGAPTGNNIVTVLGSPDGSQVTLSNQVYGNFGGNLSALVWPNGTLEGVADNIFSILGNNDSIKFYYSFTGLTTPFPQITVPTISQVGEAKPGFTFVFDFFLCPAGGVYCDNQFGSPGTMLERNTLINQSTLFSGSDAFTGSPYGITEVISIIYNNAGSRGDVSAAIFANPAAVPGPVAGAGLPGLMALGMWLLWRRRRGQTS